MTGNWDHLKRGIKEGTWKPTEATTITCRDLGSKTVFVAITNTGTGGEVISRSEARCGSYFRSEGLKQLAKFFNELASQIEE